MKLAIVRVRGDVRITHEVRRTFEQLNLRKKNHCVIVEESPVIKGMIHALVSYVTYGPVADATIASMKKKLDGKVYRLNPPRKGYGRQGIKIAFKQGGALGDRGEKMSDLVL